MADNDADLVAWLLTQLAKDEEAALAATAGPWRHNPDKYWRKPGTSWSEEAVFAGPEGNAAICVAGTGGTDDPQSMADATHIAAHDPTRVLAECETKRRIILMYVEAAADSDPHDYWSAALAQVILRFGHLYAELGRTGYREEWRQ